MKLLKKDKTIFDSTLNLSALLAAVLLIFMMILVSAEVVMRYFLGNPIEGAVEITEYTLAWITFLGAAWVLKREGHVKMDLLLIRLNPRNHNIITFITSIIGAIACLVVTVYGVINVWNQFQTGYRLATVLEPYAFIVLSVIPVSCLLLFVQFVRRTFSYLKTLRASPC